MVVKRVIGEGETGGLLPHSELHPGTPTSAYLHEFQVRQPHPRSSMLPMLSRTSSCRSIDGNSPLEENFLSCPATDACVRSRDRSADITALVDGSIGPFPFSPLRPITSVSTAATSLLTPSAADGKCKPANHCAQRYGLHGTSEGNSKIPDADARAT